MFQDWPKESLSKLIFPDQIEKVALKIKQKHKLVTLNGSFDLMHAGHLHMIYQAKAQGDKLLVALNSDESIRQYKSPLRPIVPLKNRLEMMAALMYVDYVTWFEETNPILLLSLIKPHVHVNGAEYGINCIEADTVKEHGGRLHIVNLKDGLSTSKIIEKIKTICA